MYPGEGKYSILFSELSRFREAFFIFRDFRKQYIFEIEGSI